MTRGMTPRGLLLSSLVCIATLVGCDDKDKGKVGGDLPPPSAPPSAAAAAANACSGGGGALTDAVSAPYFVKQIGTWCVDPQSEVKTYGEKAKFNMDQVCTQEWDGGCEQYKSFGLTRVVQVHYVDGNGKGGTVDVTLTKFKDDNGAYAMFTDRVVGDERDAVDPSTPRVLQAGAAGAMGTGRAYAWRGQHLLELQYNNENETPDQLAKTSLDVLTKMAKALGEKLPGPMTLPTAAQLLPDANRVANGILFKPKDAFGWKGVGPLAEGFYKDGDKRWRVLSVVRDDVDQAKDVFKTIKATPGTLPIAGQGDEAAHVVVPTGEKGNGPKIEMLIVRKGAQVWGIADEEFALRGSADQAKARVTKEDAVAKIKPLLTSAGAPSGSGSAAPKPSSSAAPQK